MQALIFERVMGQPVVSSETGSASISVIVLCRSIANLITSRFGLADPYRFSAASASSSIRLRALRYWRQSVEYRQRQAFQQGWHLFLGSDRVASSSTMQQTSSDIIHWYGLSASGWPVTRLKLVIGYSSSLDTDISRTMISASFAQL